MAYSIIRTRPAIVKPRPAGEKERLKEKSGDPGNIGRGWKRGV
jgi:hypothetical protein